MKKSYMDSDNILTEGWLKKIADFFKNAEPGIKKYYKNPDKKPKIKKGLQTAVDNLNNALVDFDRQTAKVLGIKPGKLQKFKPEDFLQK